MAVWAALLVLAVAGLVSGVHLLQVHRHYGVWSWSPPPRTPSIEFAGRRYLRGRTGTPNDLTGCVRLGTAPGGGEIYSLPPPPGAASTGVWVRYPDGTILGYALSGGP